MYKTTIVLTLLSCLLTITTASQQNCPSNSPCYSRYAGLYYLTLTNGKYTWYILVTLRADSSVSWTANDQLSVGSVNSTDSFFQPYSDALGKWMCDSKKNGQIEIQDYSFIFPTAKLPNNNYVSYETFYLDMNNSRQIKGTYEYRAYHLNTTLLNEAARNNGRHLRLDRDQVGDVVKNSVTGYQIDRFC